MCQATPMRFWLVGFLVVGCAGAAPVATCDGVSLDVDLEIVDEATEAASLWNDALGYEALCVEPGNGGLPVWEEPAPLLNTRGQSVQGFVEFQRKTCRPLYLTMEQGARFVELLHELGHVLGADHTSEGLMVDRVSLLPDDARIDAAALTAVLEQTACIL